MPSSRTSLKGSVPQPLEEVEDGADGGAELQQAQHLAHRHHHARRGEGEAQLHHLDGHLMQDMVTSMTTHLKEEGQFGPKKVKW